MKKIGVNGADGRMGRRLVALGHADPRIELAAAIEASAFEDLGKDAGAAAGIGEIGVAYTDQYDPQIEAVIDFSTPSGCETAVKACVANGKQYD